MDWEKILIRIISFIACVVFGFWGLEFESFWSGLMCLLCLWVATSE